MSARPLAPLRIEKPWGRRDLAAGFAPVAPDGEPVGEIWFDDGDAGLPLLVKYIFTSERLSVQVHPDDTAAQAAGYRCGKDEAWLILAAGEDARVALGTREVTSREVIGAAALDGSIVDMLDWRRVEAGQVIYNAAGTIHAIGADIALIEVQQNVDVTYRLYDYGRPRQLHLAEGTAVAEPVPFEDSPPPRDLGDGRVVLCVGGKFVMERWGWSGRRIVTLPDDVAGWLVPIEGGGTIDSQRFARGECWLVEGDAQIEVDGASDVLFAYPQARQLALFG